MFGGGKAVIIRNGDEFVKKYRGFAGRLRGQSLNTAMLVLGWMRCRPISGFTN